MRKQLYLCLLACFVLSLYACSTTAMTIEDTDLFDLITKDNANSRDGNNIPQLHKATFKGNLEGARQLIENGANINAIVHTCGNTSAKDLKDTTALHIAAIQARRRMVELLLRNGAEVNAHANRGVTALHYAARQHKNSVVQTLLDYGADVHSLANGLTPLGAALTHSNNEHSASPISFSRKKISRVKMSDLYNNQNLRRLIKMLISKNPAHASLGGDSTPMTVSRWVYDYLMSTFENGKLEEQRKSDLDSRNPADIYEAAEYNYPGSLHQFLDQGSNINQRKNRLTVIGWALINNNNDIIRRLIEHDPTTYPVYESPKMQLSTWAFEFLLKYFKFCLAWQLT
jgi:ankyrin repeat protein